MKRKMTSALSLFLTAAMLGTSVPSVVLAEDFSQQPDVQWDSEAVDETADPEEQDQTEEGTEQWSGIPVVRSFRTRPGSHGCCRRSNGSYIRRHPGVLFWPTHDPRKCGS